MIELVRFFSRMSSVNAFTLHTTAAPIYSFPRTTKLYWHEFGFDRGSHPGRTDCEVDRRQISLAGRLRRQVTTLGPAADAPLDQSSSKLRVLHRLGPRLPLVDFCLEPFGQACVDGHRPASTSNGHALCTRLVDFKAFSIGALRRGNVPDHPDRQCVNSGHIRCAACCCARWRSHKGSQPPERARAANVEAIGLARFDGHELRRLHLHSP